MILKNSRKNTFRLLLVVTLLLGTLTLAGCVGAAAPAASSDPVGVGLGVTVRPLENIPVAITIKNNTSKFVSEVKVSITAVDNKPGIAPFDLWQTSDASVSLTAPLLPGKSQTTTLTLQQKTAASVKPYTVDVLVTYKDADGKSQSEALKGAGLITVGNINPLSKGIRWIIEQLENLVHNYALAIILLTLILKLITEPLTRMQFKSTIDMQKLQPQINKLKEKYPNKDDQQKLSEETMKLYKDNNVNMFSGCLPLLVQWPVFLALFTAINNYSPFNNASFLWIQSLSLPDKFYILPILVAVSTYVQSITSFIPGQDRSQTAFLTYFMPILLGYWALKFSSALAMYWMLFSLFSAGQQYFVIKRLTKGMALPATTSGKQAKK